MRILVANKFWYPVGGVEAYITELMTRLPDRGYTIIPFGMHHPSNQTTGYEQYFVDNVDYNVRRKSLGADLSDAVRLIYSAPARRKISNLLNDTRPDIAHMHNIYHQLSPSILPEIKRRGIPVVMTLHDLKLVCPNYKMMTRGQPCSRCLGGNFLHAIRYRCVKSSLLSSTLCALEAFIHRWSRIYVSNVDRFVVPSQFYRSLMLSAGIPESRVVCLPNFVCVDRYEPEFRSSDYAVYVGRLATEKGLMTLLDAIARIDSKRLLIVGDGPLRARLESQVSERQLEHVSVLGPKYGAELRRLVSGARFAVLPSEWYENCPMSVLESFSLGTPVLGADIGGIPELIDDGANGWLFEAGNPDSLAEQLDRLFASDDEVLEAGRKARVTAETTFDAPGHIDRLIRIYDELLH